MDNSDVESISSVLDDDNVWLLIQRNTYNENVPYWEALLAEDKKLFELRFRDAYLENCKHWLKKT